PFRAEHVVRLDDAGDGPGDVVLLLPEQPRVFGRLAPDEGGSGDPARLGDPADDVRDPFGNDFAARDVVGHEQGRGADDDDVIDDHPDEIETDRVVNIHRLGDRYLGAHAVGGGREVGLAVGGQRGRVPKTGEAAEAADDVARVGRAHGFAHELHGAVAGLRVDAGGFVG